MTVQRRLILAVALSLTTAVALRVSSSIAEASPPPAPQAGAAGAGQCPVRAPELDRLTKFRWSVAQYQSNRVFTPSPTIRVDMCELLGRDASGAIKESVMVYVARGATAATFGKYWRDVCAQSLMAEQRGTVQPLPGVAGGFQCKTASGMASNYWVESATQTVQIELGLEDAAVMQARPQILATVR